MKKTKDTELGDDEETKGDRRLIDRIKDGSIVWKARKGNEKTRDKTGRWRIVQLTE